MLFSASSTVPPHAFGEVCTNCRGLDSDGSWIFWLLIAALLLFIAFKLFTSRKRKWE